MIEEFEVASSRQQEMIDITAKVQKVIIRHKVREGICFIFIPHTTAGVTINENADPNVVRDILYALDRDIPDDGSYEHAEGNSPAHIKASVMGSSVSLFIENGNLKLGTWQGIYLCDFDGPRSRKVQVRWISLLGVSN